jgi:hypothetical protein
MTTNKVGLRTIEEFMGDYQPIYPPIYPLFLGNAMQHVDEVGKMVFKRVDAVGDIRAHHITPKDTEVRQISIGESTKTFKKYYLANQFVISHLQSQQGVEQVVAQVLDEHQKQADEMFLTGEGTSDGTVVNNGLFFSGDANHVTEGSTAIAAGEERLVDFHNKVIQTATKADFLSGRKVIMFYGSNILPLFDSVYANAAVAWKKVLQEILGTNYTLAKIPASITPSGAHGWMVANIDQIKTHYTRLPSLEAQGSNDEKKYFWFNFLMGSMMVECLGENAVVKQPATLAEA